jgi:hypothetical protein
MDASDLRYKKEALAKPESSEDSHESKEVSIGKCRNKWRINPMNCLQCPGKTPIHKELHFLAINP